MPTYDYHCEKCGHKFEAFQGINEKHLKECPECGGKVKRMIGTGVGLIFKGSGFYITDYKNKNSSPSPPKPSDKSEKNTSGESGDKK